MGIDLAVTTLWAELSAWSPSAAEVILSPAYWAIHGATRMGKAVTFHDRLPDEVIDAAALEEGVVRARAMMELLAKANGLPTRWDEPAPPRVHTNEEAKRALSSEHVERPAPDAIERLAALAHALQAGALLREHASFDDVRVVLAAPPRSAPKPGGPFSALLAMSTSTLWVPVPLKTTWDSPAFVMASSVQLARDLAALPECLNDVDSDEAEDLAPVAQLVEALHDALESAGKDRCVVMRG